MMRDWLKPKTVGAKQLKYPAEVKARKQRTKRQKREIFSVLVVPELNSLQSTPAPQGVIFAPLEQVPRIQEVNKGWGEAEKARE
ncbi:hypothetical protein NIES3804_01370 [Microcystis aeruginosa NIES-3804]|uniref:Uncharacterized protein n=1 Tax=Microcystis aeruginosa NIES-3804 TaxID=2517783 RepID=A0A6H9GQN3_MICAE|nr:hypothetical protein NIES3804_01370 [Microcystis aeruginosa NIES-3804]